ncbi:type II toxin-antitoxin system HicB family antitoxin [Chromohalobacter nigrandesensis]|uniref:type II toxin-antitoxin system HicB family antitoxin n=1 Tax=Chromohalobacter nigrandesensis TaxID=119863 RepID=UPI001FF4EBCA|nr:type II toxin-antitoxin system HicB family antitoxin [Chromohalobacter nigrandesensis]MCK0743590.1 type II toxin-antitoxin system HicB family antitoxin [Chromohalobacter nigrandesensis]
MKTQVLEHRGYQGSVEFSIEDGVLHGSILHIVDLVTYEAETLPALNEAFIESVEDYLETCAEEEVDPDKPFRGTFNVRLGPDLHKSLALAASRQGLSLNDTMKKISVMWLKNGCPSDFQEVHHHTHEHFHPTPHETVTYRGEMDFQMAPIQTTKRLRVVQ